MIKFIFIKLCVCTILPMTFKRNETIENITIEDDVDTTGSKVAYGAFAIIGTLLFFGLMLVLTKKRFATTWTKKMGKNTLTKIHSVAF